MIRSAAIARIQQGLGFRTDLSDVIISALQEAQGEFERAQTLPWFLISEDQTFTATALSPTVALPTSFLRIVEEESPHFTTTGTTPTFLVKKPFDEALQYYLGVSNGRPQAYTLRSASISLWPTPDITYTLAWSYYKAGTALTSDIENVWLLNVPYLLIARAGLIVAADLENETATKKFLAMYDKWNSWLFNAIADRDDQAMPRSIGRNH